MPRERILLADDNVDFLGAMKEILENNDYVVIPAATFEEAKSILDHEKINLAVLDLRLRNESDGSDLSGARLAREAAHSIPKIILTAHPGIEAVREALGPMMNGSPAAIDFIVKEDDTKPLLRAIKEGLNPGRISAKRDVFIVHGHSRWKDGVFRFINDIGLNPVVLVEKPGHSKTVIEQIESHSDIGYVVALLTADDVGYERGRHKVKKYRARQNVIFELGYFMGKTGRDKVCLLISEDVEIPSDVQGIIYIGLDDTGGWKLKLAEAIMQAGIHIDAGRIVPGRV